MQVDTDLKEVCYCGMHAAMMLLLTASLAESGEKGDN